MSVPGWLKGTTVLVATLVAGVAIGVSYERRRSPPPDRTGADAHHVMHRLADQLELDSAQQQAIAAIFARRQGMVDSTWHTMQPQVRAMLDSTHREIVGVLRPDQAAKFRELFRVRHPRAHP